MPHTRDENPKTIKLGGTLEICRLGFGTIHLTNGRGFGQPRANARELLRQAAEMGVNFFDTANSYGPGYAERVIREALHPFKDLVIATKGGYEHGLEDDWRENGHPEHLRNALEGSLKRLDLERIDLYQLHTPDPTVPYEESLGALKDLHDEGKIRYVGVSRVNPDQLRKVQGILGERLVSVQNCYNLFYHQGCRRYQEPDNENILSVSEREGLVFIAWAPLASGSIEPWVLDDALLRELALRHRVTVQRLMFRGFVTDDASQVQTVYSLDGLKIRIIDGRGYIAKQKYDALGRLVETMDAKGNLLRTNYNKVGNVVVERFFEKQEDGTFHLFARKESVYDELNRQIIERENLFKEQPISDNPAQDFLVIGPGSLLETQYFYDKKGRLEKVINAKNQEMTTNYDGLDRVLLETDALGNEIHYTYDEHSNLIRQDVHEPWIDPSSGDTQKGRFFYNQQI